MKVILVHELLHACGLENSDHIETDFFYENPVHLPGNSASGDQIILASRISKIVKFPPLWLSPPTINAIKSLW